MSKCPFWSSAREKVNCYKGCPIKPAENIDDVCVFREFLSEDKIPFKEIIEEDFAYSTKDKYEVGFGY